MAKHTVTVSVPMPIAIDNSDCIIDVTVNGAYLGKVRFSRGSIDWKAANDSKVTKYTWTQFAALMANSKAVKKHISKAAPKKKTVRKNTKPAVA